MFSAHSRPLEYHKFLSPAAYTSLKQKNQKKHNQMKQYFSIVNTELPYTHRTTTQQQTNNRFTERQTGNRATIQHQLLSNKWAIKEADTVRNGHRRTDMGKQTHKTQESKRQRKRQMQNTSQTCLNTTGCRGQKRTWRDATASYSPPLFRLWV